MPVFKDNELSLTNLSLISPLSFIIPLHYSIFLNLQLLETTLNNFLIWGFFPVSITSILDPPRQEFSA